MLTTFFASIVPLLLFSSIPVLWWIDGRRLKELTLHASVSSVFSWTLSQFLKDIFQTTRPYVLYDIHPLTLTVPLDHSFPSAHTAATFALSVSVFLHNRRLGLLFLLLSLAVGTSRVIAQVHYPIDILAGSLLGSVTALCIHHLHLFKYLPKR